MLTVRITYTNGTDDIRACNDLAELCLDGVLSIQVIRDERIARVA